YFSRACDPRRRISNFDSFRASPTGRPVLIDEICQMRRPRSGCGTLRQSREWPARGRRVQPEPTIASNAFERPGVTAAATLAALLTAPLPAPTAAPQSASLVGQLLVASPSMGDPRFYQTVIVLVWHENSGAMGIVVNRPLKERLVAALLEALGEKADGAAGNVRLFAGGPVEPDRGFVVHSAGYRRADTMAIDAQLAMTASREILRDIAVHRGPKQSLVAFGYAGWGPGQPEGELAQRVWFTTPADAKIIFEEDRERPRCVAH